MTTPHQPTSHAAHASDRRHRRRSGSRGHRGGRRAGPAAAGTGGSTSRTIKLTVLGTTDLHGNVYNWDYYKNAEFDDAAHNDIGVAKVKTVIDRERAARAGQRGAHPRRG